MLPVADQLTKNTIQLILEEPFYGHLITGLIKEISTEIETIGLGIEQQQLMKLYVNPKYWNKLNPSGQQLGALKHELLHFLFKHPLRSNKFYHKPIFGIAADLVVNQYINPDQLAKEAFTLTRFSSLNWAPHQDVAYYYHRLLAAWQLLHVPNQKQSLTEEDQRLGDLITSCLKDEQEKIKKHHFWQKEAEHLEEANAKIVDHSIDRIIEQAAKRVGEKGMDKLPKALRTFLEQQLTKSKPTINWRRVLRLFTASNHKTKLKNTIRRPSKRYGTTPGIKVNRHANIMVAIDTSASIVQKDLEQFFNEIYFIWRQGAAINIIECDFMIQNTYKYSGLMPKMVGGRGGTLYNAPLILANEQLNLDALFYFTDGHGPKPQNSCRFPILWIISSNGIEEKEGVWSSLPGRVVKMN